MPDKYFTQYEEAFWEYADNDTLICLKNGYTIVYVEDLKAIVASISHQGLPPFSSLLLALTALSERADDNLKWLASFLEEDMTNIEFKPNDVIQFLEHLSKLDKIYKNGNGKKTLLGLIFKGCHGHLALNRSALIGRMCADKSYFFSTRTTSKIEAKSVGRKNYRSLAILQRKFPSTESIETQLSKIPMLEEAIEIEVDENGGFIDQLIAEEETRKIGLLVHRISSGLRIPMHSTEADDQKMGGVSDLTNKGNFDRLLLSEYANDDLTFLMRLANNETLFLSKESPPTSSIKRRVYLMDVSLHSWGTPKTISFATMVAMSKHPKNNLASLAYTVGENILPINLDSTKGFFKSLFHVDVNLSCAGGFEQFFVEHFQKNDEVYFLGEKRSLESPEMQVAIEKHNEKIKYWILNDEDGKIDFYKNLKKSRKHVQHLELPLKALWNKKITKAIELNEHNAETYFPILVDFPHRFFQLRSTENGDIYMLTRNRSILRLHSKYAKFHEVGWEVINKDLPEHGGEFEIGHLSNGDLLFISFDKKTREFYLLNLVTGEQKRFPHPSSRKGNIDDKWLFKDGKFFNQTPRETYQIDPEQGASVVDFLKPEEFASRQKINKELLPHHYGFNSVLKNVKTVGISDQGNLVLNTHKFVLNVGKHFKLDPLRQDKIVLFAKKIDSHTFEFNNGSIVRTNRDGFITLIHSDGHLPSVYIPTAIDVSLGAATTEFFAGNKYYFNKPLFDIHIQDVGNQKVSSIKTIKAISSLGLKEVKEKVDAGTPFRLNCFLNAKDRDEAITKLQNIQVQAESVKKNSHQKEIEVQTTEEFYDQFVDPFCNNIIDHGN
jgi:ribosomal protein L7/L12